MKKIVALSIALVLLCLPSEAQIIKKNYDLTAKMQLWINVHASIYGSGLQVIKGKVATNEYLVEVFDNLGQPGLSQSSIGLIAIDSKSWSSCTWLLLVLLHEHAHVALGHPPQPPDPDDWTTETWCNEYEAMCFAAGELAAVNQSLPENHEFDCEAWEDFKAKSLNPTKNNCGTADETCDEAVADMDTYCEEQGGEQE